MHGGMEGGAEGIVAQAATRLGQEGQVAKEELLEFIYDELRALAQRLFDGRGAHTLQPTALVHEAFLRVSSRTGSHLESRAHFAALCAVTMRRILADHARRRNAVKRGGGWGRIPLEVADPGTGEAELDALAIDDALRLLTERNELQARIIEFRFFSGMTQEEIAEVTGHSVSTIEKNWRMARAWLKIQLSAEDSS